MKKTTAILFFFLLMPVFCTAQSIYCITGNHELLRVGDADCSYEFLTNVQGMDVACEGNRLYGCSSDLYRIDPYNGTTQFVSDIPISYGISNAMTGDGQGNLYLAYDDLARYNIEADSWEILGSLQNLGYISEGDLEFRGDRLFLSAMPASSPTVHVILELHFNPLSATEVTSLFYQCYAMTGADLPDSLLHITCGNSFLQLNVNTGICDTLCAEEYWYPNGMTYGSDSLEALPYIPPLPEDVFVTQELETGLVHIRLPGTQETEVYRLFNVIGELVAEGMLTQNLSALDISKFAAGVYYLEVGTGDGRHYQQVLVSK